VSDTLTVSGTPAALILRSGVMPEHWRSRPGLLAARSMKAGSPRTLSGQRDLLDYQPPATGLRAARLGMSWFDALGRLTDRVNFAVARRRLGRILSVDTGEVDGLARDIFSDEPSPPLLRLYLSCVFWGWSLLTPSFGLLAVGFAFVGDKIDGNRGNGVGAGLGMVPFAAAIVGQLDVIWRRQAAENAEHRFNAVGRTMDSETTRLIRIARRNDAGLLLQALIGLVVGVVVGMLVARG